MIRSCARPIDVMPRRALAFRSRRVSGEVVGENDTPPFDSSQGLSKRKVAGGSIFKSTGMKVQHFAFGVARGPFFSLNKGG